MLSRIIFNLTPLLADLERSFDLSLGHSGPMEVGPNPFAKDRLKFYANFLKVVLDLLATGCSIKFGFARRQINFERADFLQRAEFLAFGDLIVSFVLVHTRV